MRAEKQIDDLIEAGWHVLLSDFDSTAFQNWRKQAFDCLNALCGPDHTYTQYFKHYVQEQHEANLLTGKGILIAAKETMSRSSPPQDSITLDSDCPYGA
jgi:hypothetical protein